MHIDIHTPDFPLTQELREHIETRLEFALSTRSEHIDRILVRLYDVNGHTGINDKCCFIQINLPRTSDVIVQDTESSIYAAINRAADRVSRTVTRRLIRRRDKSIYALREKAQYSINSSANTALDINQ
ncbi:HPF/RaiA family ribosome-associated protein [Kaarinaea lacus]